MGVIQSLNNNQDEPRVIWKFEYSNTQFDSFPPEVSAIIERYFLSGFTESFLIPNSNYNHIQINLSEMTHTNTHTSEQGRILRDLVHETKLNIKWSWENDQNEMEWYTSEASNQIETLYQREEMGFSQILVGSKAYWIDLKNNCQLSPVSMGKRRIERSVIPEPRFIWQWLNDKGHFIKYSNTISRSIEVNYFLKPDFPLAISLQGRNYFIDVQKLCEVDELNGQVRQIRRVAENFIKYKWLWQDKDERWHCFGSYLVEKLERNYLNPQAGPFMIGINNNQFEIDIATMTERSVFSGRLYKIKREALPNDFALWGWKTKSGDFRYFPESVSKVIEGYYLLNDPSLLNITLKGKPCQINIRNKAKVNCESKHEKQLTRRILSNNYPPNIELLTRTECSEVFKFLVKGSYLVDDWDYKQKEEVQQFAVSDVEWNILSEKFHKTLDPSAWTITYMSRVQHVSLINSFLLEKLVDQHLKRNFDEPRLLFYIGNKEEKLEKLDQAGENILEGMLSPRNDYGKGYYFTSSATVCAETAPGKEDGTKVMLCFWVLTGKVANIRRHDNVIELYNSKYNDWSEVNRAPAGADCNRVVIDGEEMFVVYNAERCYPLYVVEYNSPN